MKGKFDGIEKRRFVRLKKPVLVTFRVVDRSKKKLLIDWADGICKDISKGGICLDLIDPEKKTKQLLLRKSVVLEMKIPLYFRKKAVFKGNIEFVKVRGESVWKKKFLCRPVDEKATEVFVGISFKKLGGKEAGLITKFISQNITKTEEREQRSVK